MKNAIRLALLLLCSCLAVTSAAGPTSRGQIDLLGGERRQIFRDEVAHLKGANRPVETNHGYFEPQGELHEQYNRPAKPSKPTYQDDYRPPQSDYRPTYQKPDVYGEDQYENPKPHLPPQYDNYEPYEPPKPIIPKPYKPVTPKPYKPRPTYPKEIVMLQPSTALKSSAYADKYTPSDYRPSSVPGTPGKDYPNFASVPDTSFDCLKYSNLDFSYMYADREAGCQVFHSCHPDGRQDSFLCPLGTIFDVDTQTCDWWFNTRCI